MKQLIKFQDNWADEFNVEAFAVKDYQEIEKLFALAKIYFDLFPGQELEIGFGTNETLTFCDYEDYRSRFTVTDLTESEVEVFQKHFPQYLPEILPVFGTGSGVFEFGIFYDHFFNLYDEGNLSDDIIDKLKQIEPVQFETWFNMTDT
jgi:hypothetical protein